MCLDIALGAIKIIGGMLTQSFALVTDGIHSLTDAITDIFVLVIARWAYAEPDEKHPYGHGRFETVGSIALAIVFFTTAGILIFDAWQRLQALENLSIPKAAGISLALISIVGKEWIFRYTMRVARRLNSNLLRANAWHSRADALSSIAVLVGLVAAQLGYLWMDTVAAIVVALLIARVGWELCADSLRELVDTAIPRQRQREISDCIMQIEGIRDINRLRSRLSGGNIILEAQLLVDPRISVSEGHQLGESVRRNLIGRFSDISDVFVHIDSETHPIDEIVEPSQQPPRRHQVLGALRQRWEGLLDTQAIERVDLHYLDRGIEVELFVDLEFVSPDCIEQLRAASAELDYLAGLRIYRKLYDSQSTPVSYPDKQVGPKT